MIKRNRTATRPEIHDEAVMVRVRELVGSLLGDNVTPIVIAYAFTYVATELGLRAESDARRVLSTLLGTLVRATQEAVLADDGKVVLAESDPNHSNLQ